MKLLRQIKFIALFIIIFLPACGITMTEPTPQIGAIPRTATVILPTAEPTVAPSPTSTPLGPPHTATPIPTITPIPDEVFGVVMEVLDGNTLGVVLRGNTLSQGYPIRLLGTEPLTADNPWSNVAIDMLVERLNLQAVRIVRDPAIDLDQDGNLIRYIYLGEEMLNVSLVEQGLVNAAITDNDDLLFAADIRQAEQSARQNDQGRWGPAPTATFTVVPTLNRTDSVTTTTDTIQTDINETGFTIQTSTPAPTQSPTAETLAQ